MNTMLSSILLIARTHYDPLVRQRAKRVLRVRYGYFLPHHQQRDPVWLSAHGM